MEIKHFLKHSEIFYPLFPLSFLARYHHLIVLVLSFSWKEGLKVTSKATSAINANAAL